MIFVSRDGTRKGRRTQERVIRAAAQSLPTPVDQRAQAAGGWRLPSLERLGLDILSLRAEAPRDSGKQACSGRETWFSLGLVELRFCVAAEEAIAAPTGERQRPLTRSIMHAPDQTAEQP